jgi:hypothetical protein
VNLLTEDEPPIQYYEVIDYKTIAKRGVWWILLALCRDAQYEKTFLAFYKFQKRKGPDGEPQWQKKSSFRWNNIEHVPKVVETLHTLTEVWKEQEDELGTTQGNEQE